MKKILFVDDEVFLVNMMNERLKLSGYEMAAAYDGEEALKKVESEKPDLVLLDNMLPKLDGLTVCRRLKADPRTKNIPVIIISAAERSELSKNSASAGADDFILKPYEWEDLLGKIEKFIGKAV